MFSALYGVYVLLNLVVFFRDAELQPTFTAEPPDPFKVLEGDNITLEWSYDFGGGSLSRTEFSEITSSGTEQILELSGTGQTPDFLANDYTGRLHINVKATQTLINILGANRTVDSKNYQFEIVQSGFKKVPSAVRISVEYPPEFDRVSDNQTTVEGDPSITLECTAIGEPPPNITWTRVLDNGSDSSVLFTGEQFVLDSNRNSIGIYRCTAFNGIGTAPNRTIAVDVNYKPENITLMVNDSNVCKGDVITITCSADGKPSVHTYQLFENDVQVNDSEIDGVWTRTMSAQGSFTYRCVANNTVGTTDKNVTVTVNVPAVVYSLENITVTEGENRTLTCNVSGSPTLSVIWTEVKTGNRTMGITRELTHINRDESGEYKCEASNSCGNDAASTFLIVQYKPEDFQFAASDIEVCQDEVINFTCSADGNPAVHTYQLFENDELVTDGSNSHGMWNRTMSVGGSFIYKCVANNTAGIGESESVNVTVNVPSAIQPIQNVNVTEGHDLTLLCNVSGNPLPMVSWIKVGGDMSTSGSELVFTNISRTQAGEYMCEASNLCGNVSETASIEVQFAPDNVLLETSAVDDNACRGDVISINCSADAVPSVTSYELFENDTLILDTSGMWTKNFTTEGKFIYKCVANNSLGTGESASVTVTVNVPSAIQPIQNVNVTEGHDLTVLCNVSGSPLPMVSWIKVGGDMSTSGSELVFTNISRTQAGEYMCEASNLCGNASETASIEVQFAPDNVLLETSAVDDKACRGDVVSINCSADAVPSVTSYELFENDTLILDTSGMWTKNFTTEGKFIYKCVANNSLGTGESASVTVTVNVPSAIQPIQNVNITEGHDLTLVCNVSGNPLPMVSWIKVGGDMSTSGSELVFTNISRTQAGEYMCEASNLCGNVSETASIEVQFAPDNVLLETSAVDDKACRGDVVSINCSADAVPSVTSYELFENDTPILDTSGMWTRNFTTEGKFIYKCVANNSLGTGESASVTVTVNVKPENVQLNTSATDNKACRGDFISIYCSADAVSPEISYQLLENDTTILDDSGRWSRQLTTAGVFNYQCVPNNTCGMGDSASVIVTVNEPSMIYPIQNETITEGDSVTLSCNASGIPSPMVSWIKVDGHMTVFNGSDLVFTNINRSEAGEYRCEASNECGNASGTATIEVRYKPENVQLTTSAVDSKACKGGSISINCSADAVPDVTSYELLENGSVILDTSGMWSRTLSSGGVFIYKCVANNSLGSTESESVTVTVNVPPAIHPIQNETITEGDSVTLSCNASEIPSPMVSWIKVDGHMTVSNVSELEFTNIARSEAGEYRCEASNECGNASETARIFVQFLSSIEPLKNNTSVTKGGNVTLYCNVSGTPTPRVSWTRVSTGEKWLSKKLVIIDVKVKDLGEYKCEAVNPSGNDTKSMFIFFPGGLCAEECSEKKSCRKFGQYVCLCEKGKTGENCEQDDSVKKTFQVGIEIKEEFKPEYEDLENPTTIAFVNKLKDAVRVELNGSGINDVKVTKLRKGSVIADMEVTFNNEVGKSEVDALISEATKDKKIGEFGVNKVVTDGFIKGTEKPPEECGTFFEGEDCKKAKPGLIALCVVGGVVILAVIVAIIAYAVRKNKSNQASFPNGTYGQRVEPEGNIANGGRGEGRSNYGSVNTGFEHDRTNGHSYPSETPMVTFKSTNPAETPGIAINDSSVTQ